MGIFDFLKGGGGKKDQGGSGGDKKKSSPAAKWAEAAGSKRAQAYDRQEALTELGKLGTADAVEALLRRFTFATDPSITDQEEKDLAFEGILKAGRDAIEPVRTYVAKAESISWPLRILNEVLEPEEVIDEVVLWLSKWDTEYAKFIDPKLQILEFLGERTHPKIREATERFLEDVNDQAKFNAVVCVLAQKNSESLQPLLTLLLDEESVRIRTKIAGGIAEQGWEIADDQREAVRKALPPEFSVDGTGKIKKR
jgi:HEAT repeat protein